MKLFQSMFGGGDQSRGRYPKSLIQEAIERTVDGTDPRLRLLSGYRKRLLAPVIQALDHAVALVEALPAPLSADRPTYMNDSSLAAVFASAESMLEQLSRDPALIDFLAGPGRGAERVTALLLAGRVDRHILGMDLIEGQVRRDVPQVAVNFTGHRLLDPSTAERETHSRLKRRAFDHLLTLALARIGEAQLERSGLMRQRDLLRRKLTALEHGGWSFEQPEVAYPDQQALRLELTRITDQLHALGTEDHVLETHLNLVAELLADAPRQLWTRDVSLYLDTMNIQRHPRDPTARRIILRELHNAKGQQAVLLLLSLAPRDLPPREDFIAAAGRYLY